MQSYTDQCFITKTLLARHGLLTIGVVLLSLCLLIIITTIIITIIIIIIITIIIIILIIITMVMIIIVTKIKPFNYFHNSGISQNEKLDANEGKYMVMILSMSRIRNLMTVTRL